MAFATVQDVSNRIGRELTPRESLQVSSLLEAVTAMIETEIGRTEDDFELVPATVSHVCASAAIRAFANPYGFASNTESLGSYSASQTYAREGGSDLTLTTPERLIVRRAVYGTNSGSSRQDPLLTADVIGDDGEAS